MASRTHPKKRWAVDRHQLLILLAAAVMVGSFFLLVLWPQQRELSALTQAVDHERGLVNQKVMASHEGVLVSARIPGLRKAQDLFNRRLPPEPRVAEFLQAVAERLAAEPQVTHEIERADTRVLSGPAPAVPVRLRLVGPLDGVYRCLAAIGNLERLNRFRRVQLSRSSDDGTHIVAEAEILVYYCPAEEPKSGGTPAPAGGGTKTETGRG